MRAAIVRPFTASPCSMRGSALTGITWLAAIAGLFGTIGLAHAQVAPQTAASTFYIDPSAPDNGDGSLLHPYNSWAAVSIQSGNAYLQRAGTVYHGSIDVEHLDPNRLPTVIGSYGDGAPPRINRFASVTRWRALAGNIYASAIDWNGGEVAEDGQSLNFIPWSGSVQAAFSPSINGTYTFDPNSKTIYLRTREADAASAHDMQVAHGDFGITIRDSAEVTINGLEIVGASRHGVLVANSQNCVLTGMNIHDGGGQWDWSIHAYLGNGVEFADGSSNGTLENSRIWNNFDSGVTVQLYDPGKPIAKEFVITGDRIYQNGFAGVELAGIAPNVTVSDITISDSAIHHNGLGWSNDRGGKGHGVYEWTASNANSRVDNVTLSGNNVYANAGHGIDADQAHGSLTLKGNSIERNRATGVFLSDDKPGNGDHYLIVGNVIRGNAGSGLSLNNWASSGFVFCMNTVADNGSSTIANFLTDGFGPGLQMRNNQFVSHSGPAITARYNYWQGGNVDHNSYTGPTAGLISAGNAGYGLAHIDAYRALTGQDAHSSFSAD